MTDDTRPWLRCRCVHRSTVPDLYGGAADPYFDRCPERPDGEDGLCAHCRQPAGRCQQCAAGWNPCCRHPTQTRKLVDLAEPCFDRQTVPF